PADRFIPHRELDHAKRVLEADPREPIARIAEHEAEAATHQRHQPRQAAPRGIEHRAEAQEDGPDSELFRAEGFALGRTARLRPNAASGRGGLVERLAGAMAVDV